MDNALAVLLASTVGVLVGFVAGYIIRHRRRQGLSPDAGRLARLAEAELEA